MLDLTYVQWVNWFLGQFDRMSCSSKCELCLKYHVPMDRSYHLVYGWFAVLQGKKTFLTDTCLQGK